MTNQQNRTLGAFEKTFWLLDQIDSKDFALAAEIQGKESVAAWRLAINRVQQRHPNLSVRIKLDNDQRAVAEHIELPIPLRVVEATSDYRWQQEVEKELATRFDTEVGPLMRIVLVQKPENTVLILVANHTLADGTSLNYLFRDILNAVTGKQLEVMAPQRSNDEVLGMSEDFPLPDAEKSAYVFEKIAPVSPKVDSIRFTNEQSLSILEKSRAEGTTVHGAICAAAVTAARELRNEWTESKLELISPICTRKPLQLDDNCGLNITTHPVYYEPEENQNFWDIARFTKSGLAGTDTIEHVQNYIGFFRDLTFNSTDIQKMVDILKEAFNHQIMVTNLVKVKYDTDFGKLKLNAVYGPMVRSGKGNEQTIGAISSNGCLCLTNTSDNPIPGILSKMQQLLLEASDVTVESFAR